MPSLDDLKKRIKSVKSTQKITKAMKMVAAAKLKKAQESAEKGRPYSDKMQNIILNLTKSFKENSNAPKLLLGSGEDSVYLCVIMTADRGLCGGFNTNITKKVPTPYGFTTAPPTADSPLFQSSSQAAALGTTICPPEEENCNTLDY